MSALVEGARRVMGRGAGPVGERLEALAAAATLARGRLDDVPVDRAESVVRRGEGRLALTGGHTVVALAGATGSGKSSTFNAVAGAQVAAAGVRRPTTAVTTGVAFGEDDAAEVLDWLDVRRRDHLPAAYPELAGLVLLDLPDHDSTEVAHHHEVDRLVELVDVLVWVLDPQKYADAAVHERYLRPLATHRDVMVVALNHIDEVAPAHRAALLADLTHRLEEDGLTGVPVVATSARDGDGIPELRAIIARRVGAKKAAAARLSADVAAVGRQLEEANGKTDPAKLRRADRDELVEAFADAAGIPTVVRAVERSVARRGAQRTGWPFTGWVAKARPDPLRRLHLDLDASGKELVAAGRTSLPAPTKVQRARVDTAVRSAAGAVADQLTPPWAEAVRRASTSRLEELDDALDRAVTSVDLGAGRVPLWWRVARLLQMLLALAVVVGAVWLLGLVVLGYLQLPEPSTPSAYGLPLPTLLLLAGLAGGVALAVLGRLVNRLVARSRARAARRRLREAIAEVTDALVLAPIDAELAVYGEVRRSLDRALR